MLIRPTVGSWNSQRDSRWVSRASRRGQRDFHSEDLLRAVFASRLVFDTMVAQPPGDSPAPWAPRLAREAALKQLDLRIAAEPDSIGPRLERADLLSELGRTLEARNAYLEVLVRSPIHRLALNNLGTLLHATGYRTAARTAYTEAAARHPDDA